MLDGTQGKTEVCHS